jgi:hypothetical protein
MFRTTGIAAISGFNNNLARSVHHETPFLVVHFQSHLNPSNRKITSSSLSKYKMFWQVNFACQNIFIFTNGGSTYGKESDRISSGDKI